MSFAVVCYISQTRSHTCLPGAVSYPVFGRRSGLSTTTYCSRTDVIVPVAVVVRAAVHQIIRFQRPALRSVSYQTPLPLAFLPVVS
jgi:hypothetical protein